MKFSTSVDHKQFVQALSILMHCIGVNRLDGWLFLVSFGWLEFGIRIQTGTYDVDVDVAADVDGDDDDDDDDDSDDHTENSYVMPIQLTFLQWWWLKRASLGT